MLRELFRRSFVDGSTTLIARDVFQEIGGFDERWRFTQDLEMWIRILGRYEFARVPEVLGRQRRHPSRGSSNVAAHLAELQELYSEKFQRLGMRRLFPDRDVDPDSPTEIARFHVWFADSMAHGHHFFELADQHCREAVQIWNSWRNPARFRALVGARFWTGPRRFYRVSRHRLGVLRRTLTGTKPQ
jgi:hypothetical protein